MTDPAKWTDDEWIAAMQANSMPTTRRPDRPTIALHFQMTHEFVSRMTWAQIGEILETELRQKEDFYEYVDDPKSHPVSWSYVADDGNGFRREYIPNTPWPSRCMYIVAIATFEAS